MPVTLHVLPNPIEEKGKLLVAYLDSQQIWQIHLSAEDMEAVRLEARLSPDTPEAVDVLSGETIRWDLAGDDELAPLGWTEENRRAVAWRAHELGLLTERELVDRVRSDDGATVLFEELQDEAEAKGWSPEPAPEPEQEG